MDRLISADALKQALRKCQIESLIAHNEEKNVFDIINEQPTAYDVEKVVAELEKNCHIKYEQDDYGYCLDAGKYVYLSDAIGIVKAGGVE